MEIPLECLFLDSHEYFVSKLLEKITGNSRDTFLALSHQPFVLVELHLRRYLRFNMVTAVKSFLALGKFPLMSSSR